jgi:DNA-binding transcriptional regulator YiaG
MATGNRNYTVIEDSERKTMSNVKIIEKIEPREIRRKLGLNQQQFWSKIGVTQSGGSRYESGRNMPKPVRELLRLVHVEQVDIQRIKREDVDVIEYLKSQEPELFKTLKKSAKAKVKKVA